MKKRLLAAVLIAVLTVLAAGCSKPEKAEVTFEPTGNALFLRTDGTVTSYVQEGGFDKAYYSAEELRTKYVAPAVAEYNQAKAGVSYVTADEVPEPASAGKGEEQEPKLVLPAAIDAVSLENGTAILEMTYATGADYIAFNQNQLPQGCQLWATPAAGQDVSTYALTAVEGVKAPALEKITEEDAKRKCFVACIQVPGEVKVQGQILYISDASVMTDDYTVKTDGSKPVYLIFE